MEGDILETADEYLRNHSAMRIAFLHIDVDVYNPTKAVLEKMYDRVVEGGLIVFDDYEYVNGATEAIEEFLAGTGKRIEKLPYYAVPSYIIK